MYLLRYKFCFLAISHNSKNFVEKKESETRSTCCLSISGDWWEIVRVIFLSQKLRPSQFHIFFAVRTEKNRRERNRFGFLTKNRLFFPSTTNLIFYFSSLFSFGEKMFTLLSPASDWAVISYSVGDSLLFCWGDFWSNYSSSGFAQRW